MATKFKDINLFFCPWDIPEKVKHSSKNCEFTNMRLQTKHFRSMFFLFQPRESTPKVCSPILEAPRIKRIKKVVLSDVASTLKL